MADLDAFYRNYLKNEFQRRVIKNPRYSLRAYAKNLGIDNGFLSKLLTGKALLSLDLADILTKKLKLMEDDRKQFLLSAAEEQRCHALYLLDPALTDCNSENHEINLKPLTKKRKC
jgi:hypothetical protein